MDLGLTEATSARQTSNRMCWGGLNQKTKAHGFHSRTGEWFFFLHLCLLIDWMGSFVLFAGDFCKYLFHVSYWTECTDQIMTVLILALVCDCSMT